MLGGKYKKQLEEIKSLRMKSMDMSERLDALKTQEKELLQKIDNIKKNPRFVDFQDAHIALARKQEELWKTLQNADHTALKNLDTRHSENLAEYSRFIGDWKNEFMLHQELTTLSFEHIKLTVEINRHENEIVLLDEKFNKALGVLRE